MKRIVVIIGGSGSGKTTVAQMISEMNPSFHRLVTTTTRSMREGEVPGISYHFVTKEEFHNIEKLEENEYVGNLYGLSKKEVDEKLEIYDQFVVVLEVNGAEAIKKIYGDMVRVVFLSVPPDELERRMRNRGEEEFVIEERLKKAHKDKEFSKPKIADIQINNIDLDTTIQEIIRFINKEA